MNNRHSILFRIVFVLWSFIINRSLEYYSSCSYTLCVHTVCMCWIQIIFQRFIYFSFHFVFGLLFHCGIFYHIFRYGNNIISIKIRATHMDLLESEFWIELRLDTRLAIVIYDFPFNWYFNVFRFAFDEPRSRDFNFERTTTNKYNNINKNWEEDDDEMSYMHFCNINMHNTSLQLSNSCTVQCTWTADVQT